MRILTFLLLACLAPALRAGDPETPEWTSRDP